MPIFLIIAIILAAVSLVLGVVMRPKIRDTSEPASLKDFNAPTASENRPIPVIWGTVKMTGPNVTWYGDLQTVKLMNKKAKVGLGFRYSIGMEIGLCHGPVDGLLEIGFGDKSAWTGNIAGNSVTGQNFTVDNRTLFGGDSDEQLQNGGYGGVYAECTFYRGIADQQSNAYLSNVLTTENPGHSDVCYLMWNGPSYGGVLYNYDLSDPNIKFEREPFISGYIGTNPRVDDIWFVLRRLPNFLNPTYHNINNGDANPMDVIYELLTNSKYGMGLASSFIDTVSFNYAQQKLYEEGLGLSEIWDSEKKISELLNEILQYIDGVLYTDLQTGLLTIKLARDDYWVGSLPVFNESNISEISNYSSPSIDETTNQIQLSYVDRLDKFKSKITVAHDLANARSQNEIISASVSYIGISNGTVANKIAFRDLRVLSYPLDKITFTTNRYGTILRPADVFIVDWPEFGFTNKVFRAIRVSYGQLVNGICEIDAIEDVFSLGAAIYGANDDSGWEDPVGSATIPLNNYATESPKILSGDDHKIIVASAKPNNYQMSFNSYSSVGNANGTYAQISNGDPYTPTGLLSINYSGITQDVDPAGITVTPSTPNTLTFLQNFPEEYVRTNNNLALITDGIKEEFISFQNVAKSGNNYILTNVWRGLLDTVPQSWSSGARLWFIDYGASEPSQTFNGTDTVYVKVQSTALKGQSDLSTSIGVILSRRSLKPYPPGHFRINGSTSTVNIAAGSDIVVSWEHRNRNATTLTKQFESGILPEPGTKYYLKFFNAANALVRTVGPLDEVVSTYTYTNVDQLADNGGNEPKVVTVQLYSKREGLSSLYSQQRTLIRPTGTPAGEIAYNPGADSYTPMPTGSASSLNGIRLIGEPTNSQVLAYNSITNSWEPSNVSNSIAGDVTGALSSSTVVRLRNRNVSPATPTNGQVLTWSTATSSWEPSTPSSDINLNGDVTGNYSTNTVVKIQNRAVSSTTPSNGQALVWSDSENNWKPDTVSGSSTATPTPILTYFSSSSQNITVNNTWTNLVDMELAGSTTYLANWMLNFTCVIGATSADNEKLEFRFVLDDSVYSESWFKSKSAAVSNSEQFLLSMHTVFENVSPNVPHNFKVQWRDYQTSSVDVTILNRRITATPGAATTDPNFIPTDISGNIYWFKADALGLANDAAVDQMTDYSGNNRHFTAKNSGTKGVYKTSQVNGKAAIKFNHDGNGSTTTNTQYNGPSFMTSSQGEIFLVIKSPADPAASNLQNTYGYFGPDDSSTSHYPFTNGDVYETFGTSARKQIPNANTTTPLTNWSLYNVSSKASEWVARINDTVIFSTTSNTVSWRSAPIFGGTSGITFGAGFNGLIAEVIVYNSVLTAADRLKVRAYIAGKYGI